MMTPMLEKQISVAFGKLNSAATAKTYPRPASLSSTLDALLPVQQKESYTRKVDPDVAALFVTAAVDMWLRAVHSFAVSIHLTPMSPLWASCVGYYSSHYSVRALAHLLGHFLLFGRRQLVALRLEDGGFVCNFRHKSKSGREHQFYWQVVKRDPLFANDPLFTENKGDDDQSDVAHRDRANYADHLGAELKVVESPIDNIRKRVRRISQMTAGVPPIPCRSKYPDIDAVQIVAYRRLVRFRMLVDNVLGTKNRFWAVHRNPAWSQSLMDFQLADHDAAGLEILSQ